VERELAFSFGAQGWAEVWRRCWCKAASLGWIPIGFRGSRTSPAEVGLAWRVIRCIIIAVIRIICPFGVYIDRSHSHRAFF
jgi:hypothetical protein